MIGGLTTGALKGERVHAKKSIHVNVHNNIILTKSAQL